MCRILEYYLSLEFLKGFRNTTEVKSPSFQDSIESSDFDSNSMKTQSLTSPENGVFNYNMCEQF